MSADRRTDLLAQLDALTPVTDMREHSRFNLQVFAQAVQQGVPGSLTITYSGKKNAPVDINFTSAVQ